MKGPEYEGGPFLIGIGLTNLVGLVTTSEITLALFIISHRIFYLKQYGAIVFIQEFSEAAKGNLLRVCAASPTQ